MLCIIIVPVYITPATYLHVYTQKKYALLYSHKFKDSTFMDKAKIQFEQINITIILDKIVSLVQCPVRFPGKNFQFYRKFTKLFPSKICGYT